MRSLFTTEVQAVAGAASTGLVALALKVFPQYAYKG